MKYISPFVNWALQYKNLKKEIDERIFGCLRRGDIIARGEVEEFEKRLADFVGTKHAIGMNSGTDALYLSLRAAGVGKGDEVITVSWTFIATIATIDQVGAKPILIDINENYVMNPDLIEAAITPKTKAIIPVHFNGVICDMDRIMEIADKHNLIVIEDAAQALSRTYKGRQAGSIGLTGCFSFYPSKLVGAYGDAGALTTNDEEIYKKVKILQDHGRVTKTETVAFGVNSRMDEIQAAIINVKFNHLKETKKRREEIARMYKKGIKDIPQIKMILPDDCENFVMQVEKRDELFRFLVDVGVETQIHEVLPYHKIEALNLHFDLPITEQMAKEVITLPLNAEVQDREVMHTIKCLKEFYSIK